MLRPAQLLRRANLRRSPIRQIMELAAPENIVNLGLDPDDVISFAGGWVNHAAPEELRAEYARLAADPDLFHECGAYSPTRGLPRLISALLRADRELYATPGLKESQVIVGQSSTQLTFSLFVALLDPGDRVVLLDPTYANYAPQLEVCDRDLEIVTLPVLDAASWSMFADPEAFLERLDECLTRARPRLLLLCSPDNPTGQIIPDEIFLEILNRAESAACFVAVDYAYRAQYFTDEQPRHFSASPADHPNLIKIHSNSKWCRGLGRRLGWIEAPDEVVEALEIVQQSMVLCPDTMHQLALAAYLERALDEGSLRRYLEVSRDAYATAAAALARCLEEHLRMPFLRPQGGLYTVVDVGADGDKFARDVLEATGVIFVPGKGFGTTLTDAIRVSFGPLVNDLGTMEEGFARVSEFLSRTG